MSATYTMSPDAVVHLMQESGDGEFTFCSRDSVQAVDGGFDGVEVSGPATCTNCKASFDRMREGMKGARWRTDT